MNARVVPTAEYWAIRKPVDQKLPDNVPAEEVEADLDIMQERFRQAMAQIGAEDDDWELPWHYQHVRVFYAYLYSNKLYCPQLTVAMTETMKGFEESWIGEFECYETPGCEEGATTDIVYLNREFVFKTEEKPKELIAALKLNADVPRE